MYGIPQNTFLNQALQALGLDPETASYAEMILGLGSTGVAAKAVTKSFAQASAANQAATGKIGVPITQAKNPLSPVQQFDAYGNEIVYRTMSREQFEIFKQTGVMPATAETSISPVLSYSSKYDGVTVKITTSPGTSAQLQEIGIAANKPAASQFPNMSTQTGQWMQTNARFEVEGGQMTTQLGQGKALEIFNKNIIHFEWVK
jgi:filamentous hemagglutinin